MKHWDRTDFIILTLALATKTETSLTRFMSIKLVQQEDFSQEIALIYFADNCLDLPLKERAVFKERIHF